MSLLNTHYGHEKIAEILEGKKRLFFDGIGGVSMNSLAHISKIRGYDVSGYDRTETDITRKLERNGIKVYYESSEEHMKDRDALIYTVAIPKTNAEYLYAEAHGIPTISRGDYLGYIMTGYRERIGVSGTHGKSTTTGMLAKIFASAGKNPTVHGGAELKETGETDIIGGHDCFIFEACEYMDSFLDFNPTIAVVLNIELDHMDYFKSIEQIRSSFTKYMDLPGCRAAVINADDENCRLALDASHITAKAVTFGRNNPKADYYSTNEDNSSGYPEFDVASGGKILAHIHLQIPGEHNIYDSLAAFASCMTAGLTPEETARGISEYRGIRRRMEKICTMSNGAELFTDYAHHPTEIAATLSSARKITRGKLRIVFQPHTYSRTAELFDWFTSAFAHSDIDELILCPIYAARETNTYGVSSEKLCDAVNAAGKSCRCASNLEEAAEIMERDSRDGDVVIVMGAGDVIKIVDMMKDFTK